MNLFSRPNPGVRKIRPRAIRRIFHHFGRHMRPHWRALLVAWICTLGTSATELLRPWPIKVIFDVILAPQAKAKFLNHISLLSGDTATLLAVIAASILLIAVLGGLFGYGQAYLIASVGQNVVAAIRRQLYSHIQRLSHSFHDTHHSGDLLMRLTGDISLLRELMVGSVLDVSDRVFVLLGMLTIMIWMDWQLALVAFSILPFLSLAVFRFSGRIRGTTKEQRRKESQIASVLSERISAIKVVQAFAREAYEDEHFSRRDNASLKAGLKTTRLETNLNRLIDVLLAAGTCGVLWLGVKRVLAGILTPGDLLVFTIYLAGFYKPIRKLATLTSRISKATACGERITSILETEPEIKDAPDAIVAPPFRGDIVFEKVSFRYLSGEPVLNEISFTMKPGETVALVGPSGVGKSTVANLLLRFYDPQEGRVLVDGTDIRRYTLASLREQVAVVLQESLLFNTTIRENIAYGKLDATMAEIVAAAKAANAHDFIQELANGYETVVSERGESLSGGQRQRIAIARALIRNTPIVILDEPMAGLDVESEARVREALRPLTAGKTCLLITHDLQAAAEADLVLVLQEGRIVERGRHAELMERSQQYRQLYEVKMGRDASRKLSMEAASIGERLRRPAPLATPPQYEPLLLRQLKATMSSTMMMEILRRDWRYPERHGLILKDCQVIRVHPREGKDFVLEYEMRFLNGDGEKVQKVFGVLVGAEAEKRCGELIKKLRKRGQLSREVPTGLVTCLPNLGLILQFPGLDPRLRGLEPALDPVVMRPILSQCLSLEGGEPTEWVIDVLGHRLGKRCVIRYRLESVDPKTKRRLIRSLIGKVYKSRGDRGRQVFDAMRSLWERGFGDEAEDKIRIPKPLAYVPEWQLLLMEDAPGSPLAGLEGPVIDPGIEAAGRALGKLHRCVLEVPGRHSPADEVELLNSWVAIISQIYPEMNAALGAALAEVRRAIDRCRGFKPALVHRDFYEKQVLVDGLEAILIDLDTLCVSDPAIDVGNFVAHLKLAGLQRLESFERLEEAFLAAYRFGPSWDRSARVEAYTKASLLRLACLYSLWPRWSHLTEPLLAALADVRIPGQARGRLGPSIVAT